MIKIFFISIFLFSVLFSANKQNQLNPTNKSDSNTYYISTNLFSTYLNTEFSFESEIKTNKTSVDLITNFFLKQHKNIYNIFKIQSDQKNEIYQILSAVYDKELLMPEFAEYINILNELAELNSSIDITEVQYKKIKIISNKKNKYLVRVVWMVHGIVRHPTHDHERKNINCVDYRLIINNDLVRIYSEKIISIDRFDLYQ